MGLKDQLMRQLEISAPSTNHQGRKDIAGDWVIKTLEQQCSESFWVGESLLGGWHTPRSWAQKVLHSGSFQTSPHVPLYPLFICTLFNKLINGSEVPFWDLWAILANYQTWRGGCGNPRFIAGWSEVQVAQDLLWASQVGADLWDWTLKLWGLC